MAGKGRRESADTLYQWSIIVPPWYVRRNVLLNPGIMHNTSSPNKTQKRDRSLRIARWLLPVSAVLVLAGYVGPWIPHPAAGLVVTGLDLAEYVKFLDPVRRGALGVWRQGFYLPLVAVSLTLILYAYRRDLGYPWPIKIALLGIAAVAALNLLPPAWSPGLLITAEFRLQTATLLFCMGMAGISPILALLPRTVPALIAGGLAFAALLVPITQFLRILPPIADVYGSTIALGWGVWLLCVGLVGMMAAVVFVWRKDLSS